MTRFTIDPTASKLLVHTFAEGLFSRLAHDLELASAHVEGSATLDGESWSAELHLDPTSLRVAGVLRGDQVDAAALSTSDRDEIERRMRADVFGPSGTVKVTASGQSRSSGDATTTLGRTPARSGIELTVIDAPDNALRASGRLYVSLKALGVRPIKGPLGAFSVADTVEIRFDLALLQA